MKGASEIESWKNLCERVDDIGFLPLQECGVPGFSVQGMTNPARWNEDGAGNPWFWRYKAVESGRVVYGKFFRRHVGFVSKECLPAFANLRRGGRSLEELACSKELSSDSKRILELLSEGGELSSPELRTMLEIDAPRTLDAALAELTMRFAVVLGAFRRRRNRAGRPVGWPVGVWRIPESIPGIPPLSVSETPEESLARLTRRCVGRLPRISEERLERLLRSLV